MGTYATTTALDDLMIGVDFSLGTTATLASKCIDQAESFVNKYLVKRYDISSFLSTSTSVPPLVRSMTEEYSEGLMWGKLSRGSKSTYIERGKMMRDEVKDCLKEISKYELDLFNTAGSLITDRSDANYRIQSTTNTYVDTFAEDSPLEWQVDSDKLDDIDGDRD